MLFRRCCSVLGSLALIFLAQSGHAQLSKGYQILINRGFQVQALAVTYDNFHLTTLSNAGYTAVCWTWDPPRPYSNNIMSQLGAAPGFPWSRWAVDESDMPPKGQESPYLSQEVCLQLADEWDLNNATTRQRAVDWFNSVRSNYPNTILYMNNWGGQIYDYNPANLQDYVARAQPDMMCFDTYPWQSVWDSNAPNHIGAPIGGPPTGWYGYLRSYRDISRSYGIPFACYMQTFHSVQDFNTTVYRSPSASELRLNHSGALAFGAKALIDFVYNNGSSSLFTAPGGDSFPNALYYEKADCSLRARNLGKALVRLRPIDETTTQWTTSVMFVRGKDANGNLNPIPINFYAGPSGTNPNTDWVADRNDPYLRGWVVTNTGTMNNGQPGDVVISWFKTLDESFDGPATNEIYFMVVNGLTATNGTAADCSQEIKLNFLDTFTSLDMLDPVSGQLTNVTLPVVSTRRQLTLNLNGGDAALFKIADGAQFVGFSAPTNPPVINVQPASTTVPAGSSATFNVNASGALPLSYRWRFNGTNIAGATASSYTRTNAQAADAGNYTVVVTNSYGSVTSAPAALTVNTGTLLLYEPFDYANLGGPVSSNTPSNWAYGGSGANDLSVVSGSLAYPGLATSVGNSVTNGGVGLGVRRIFGAPVSSGPLYFSALFRINDLGYGTWNGAAAQAGAFADTNATSNFRLAVMIKSNSPSGYVLGVQKGGTGVTATFDTSEFHTNQTIFLVGKYDFDVSPNSVSLWINPHPSTYNLSSPPAATITANTGTDGFVIDRFNMRQNTAASVPAAMQWDELRVGNTWAVVTPTASGSTAVQLTDVTRLGDGTCRFAYSMSGLSGTIYGSTNLTDWTAIGSATQAGPGLYQFTDTTATNFTRRFYQLRFP